RRPDRPDARRPGCGRRSRRPHAGCGGGHVSQRWTGRGARGVLRAAALTAAAAAVGAASAAAAALVAGRAPGGSWTVAPVVGAAAAGALSWPMVRRRADAAIDHLVHGGRRAPDEVVRSFEAASGRSLPLPELLVQLAESLVRTFGA